MQLEVGAKGPETNFVTGAFVLDDPLARQILAVLPPVIRMRPEVEQGVPSFLENIQFITREVETDRPGSEIVLLRMADVIFIQILRAYLARVPDDGGGFLGALRDPSTAAALGAMHHRAEAPWTVASLAKEVGLSRSVFAARFTQLVGEPPLGYLTRLRMQKAATLLRVVVSQRSSSLAWTVIAAGGFVGGILFWGGFNWAMEMTNTEAFCIGCHEMRDNPYKELQQTIHFKNRSGVRAICSDCHVPHEWFAKIRRKI